MGGGYEGRLRNGEGGKGREEEGGGRREGEGVSDDLLVDPRPPRSLARVPRPGPLSIHPSIVIPG